MYNDYTRFVSNILNDDNEDVNFKSNASYNNILEHGLDSSNVAEGDKYPYPFMVVKSVNTGDCLQNNYGSLSIEPCQIRKSQRWMGINNPVLCK